MTGRTSQFLGAVAGLKAAALIHLLDLADGLVAPSRLGSAYKHRPERVQRHSGPKIIQAAAALYDSLLSYQMALFADGRSKRMLQVAGIDDGGIGRRGGRVALLPAGDMQLPRTVAALAADGVTIKHRFPVAVHRAFHIVDAVGMAVKALRQHRPSRHAVLHEARGQVPFLFLGKPADGRLE